MSIFKRKSFWITLVIIVIIIVIIIAAKSKGQKEEDYNTIIVERHTLEQTVSETGKVVSDPDIELSFQTNGIIRNIYHNIGDAVQADDVISQLESGDQNASIAGALAALDSARAALNLRLAGATDEEIDISKANVQIAEVSLETSQNNLESITKSAEQNIKNAEVALEKTLISLDLLEDASEINQGIQDAYNNIFIHLGTSMLTIFNGIQTADSVIGFDDISINDDFERYLSVNDRQAWNDANVACPEAENKYGLANDYYQSLTIASTNSEINHSVDLVDEAFLQIDQCLYYTRLVLENSITTISFTTIELDTLTTNVDTSKTNVRNGISALEGYKQALNSASNAFDLANQDYEAALQNLETVTTEAENQMKSAHLDVKAKESALAAAQAELDLKESDPRSVDLAGLYAEINRAQANLDGANYSLRKTQIVAPVKGVVSKMEYDVGENIAAFTSMTEIITDAPQIELDISETDIAKIELDDEAEITLDAYGDDIIFNAKVVFIEPAETEIAGVIYYKIKLVFTGEAEKEIKPGMTANVIITTDKKENVIGIPHRAIISKNGTKFVRVLKWGKIEEVEVQTGLKGDSNTEITSGLKEGDEVVTFIKSE